MTTPSFKSLLAEPPAGTLPLGIDKQAAIESPDEMQLEQDFAHLAYSFLQDRAPGLIPYILGFEVVEREEDGSRAVGIFGFKIGKEFYYVPAFWVNNQVKGMDLLYSKKSNTFMPLREGWINHIVNKQTIELGKTVEASRVQDDFENPNFDFLAEPPIGAMRTKRGAASKTDPLSAAGRAEDYKSRGYNVKGHTDFGDTVVSKGKKTLVVDHETGDTHEYAEGVDAPYKKSKKKASEVIVDGFSAWNDIQQAVVDTFDKDAEFQMAFAGAISAMTGEPLNLEKSAEGSDLLDWVSNKGGVKAVNALMRTVTEDVKFASAALAFYPDVESLMVTQFDESLAVKTAAKITVETAVDSCGPVASEKTKKRLIRDGFAINDPREEDDTSEVYDVNYQERFSSPDSSGLYNVLLRSGASAKAWVFLPSAAGQNPNSLIVEPGKRFFAAAEPDAVYVRGDKEEDGDDPYEKAVDLDDMELSQKYVLIDADGHSTGPVEVRSVIAENDKRVKYRVYWSHTEVTKRPTYGHDFETLHKQDRYRGEYAGDCIGNDINYIQVAPHTSNKLAKSGDDTLVIPSNWKALKLYDGSGEDYETERMMRDAFTPGSMNDVFAALTKSGFSKLALCSDDGLEYYMRHDDDYVVGSAVGYKEAFVSLVGDYGLSVDDAEIMLKDAHDKTRCERMVKVGQLVGVNMPQMELDTNIGTDDFSGAQMETNVESQQRGSLTGNPVLRDPMQPGFNMGGEAAMDQGSADLASQAANAGQKQIFDHAAIGGLAKLYDAGSVIDGYIPQLLQSLDRIGRILFLFYWKNEEFAERYGTEDLAEMEDMIRGVFKSFGDLVLQLREKTIDAEDADSGIM